MDTHQVRNGGWQIVYVGPESNCRTQAALLNEVFPNGDFWVEER